MKRTEQRSPLQESESWQADAKLTQAAASGDPTAQRELLTRAMPFVRQAAQRLLAVSHEREDIVQSSLLEVLRSAPRFEGRSSLGTWVTRIAIRTTLRLTHKEQAIVVFDAAEVEPAAAPQQRVLEELPREIADYLGWDLCFRCSAHRRSIWKSMKSDCV